MDALHIAAAVAVVVGLIALGCWICGSEVDQDWGGMAMMERMEFIVALAFVGLILTVHALLMIEPFVRKMPGRRK